MNHSTLQILPTVEQLAKWLEEDGHPGCAEALLGAGPAEQPHVARQAADCAENDPAAYDDDMARALPGELRKWASAQPIVVSKNTLRISPNGVSHLIPPTGPCATCGKGRHSDWELRTATELINGQPCTLTVCVLV